MAVSNGRAVSVATVGLLSLLAALLVPVTGASAQGSSGDCVWSVERSEQLPGPLGSVALGDGASWSLGHQIEAWSPDRNRIAYIGFEGDDFTSPLGLRVSLPDGSRNRLVRSFADPFFGSFGEPIWSPDGRRIAVIGRFEIPVGGGRQVFVVDVATGAMTQVSDAPAGVIGTVAWTPDSTRLAWPEIRPTGGGVATDDDQRDVFVGNADGSGTPTEIITTAFFPAPSWPIGTTFVPPGRIDGLAFSPDGTRLAFTGFDFAGIGGTGSFSGDLWVADADGSDITQLSGDNALDDPRSHSQPRWSPDGTRLAVGIFSGTGGSQTNGVAVVDASSGSFLRTFATGNPTSAAAWNDDGNRIAFTADRGNGSFQNDLRIATVSSGAMRTVLRGSDEGLAEDLVDWVPCLAAPPTCNGRPATIIGTNRADRIRGTNRADVIVTFGGRDRIFGRAGNDTICSGGGSDIIRASGGNDWVSGGAGPDTVFGQGGNDRLRGDGGRDRLVGGRGNDRLDGGPGRDICRPGPGADRLRRCP
ncbi:MAG: hypothetical protein ACE367_06310 [Acidimicrobiales bacterium]